eukprot:GHVL01006984.1.p1 GENE.GHVL01006984.1~~GHVL01006984.1.p1  ORF type:complete len:159 (+),score=23.76 GHVL01006984.1:70-477(+)
MLQKRVLSKYIIEKNNKPDNILIKNTYHQLIYERLIFSPLLIYFLGKYIKCELVVIPNWFTVILHLTVAGIIHETLFYWLHRFLHISYIYKYIHKKHHKYIVSVSIASQYAHPIESIIANILPTIFFFYFLILIL